MKTITAFIVALAVPACLQPPAELEEVPAGYSSVDLDSELASALYVDAVELDAVELDTDGDGLVAVSELAPDDVRLDLADLTEAPPVIAAPVEQAAGLLRIPKCYFQRTWNVWHEVQGYLCVGGVCSPIKYKVLVQVTCENSSYCNWATENVIECSYVDPYGVRHEAAYPSGRPNTEYWQPCNSVNECDN